MKHVFDTHEIPHLWAHQTQNDARNKQNNLFFDGDTIYSYGRHFPIARHITNTKGARAIAFTTRSYSVTTSGHISAVRSAIPNGVQVFHVCDVTAKLGEWSLNDVQERINSAALLASKARTNKETHLDSMRANVEEFTALAKFIGSRRKPKTPTAKWLEEQVKAAKEENRKAREQRKAREAQQAEARRLAEVKRQENRAKWLAGENVPFHTIYGESDLMRIEGDEVATSKGARVPLEHVRKVAPLIISLLEQGKTYQRNGHTIHLGHYAIDSLDSDGVLRVGCHKFERCEVLRINSLIQ